MGYKDGLNELIDGIYEAALAQSGAEQLLEKIAVYTGYEVAAVVTTGSKYSSRMCRASVGIDQAECEKAEQEYGVSASITRLRGREIRAGEFGFREEFVSDADFRNQAFYHGFVVPNRIQEGAKICLENSDDQQIFANLARPVGGFSEEHRRYVLAQLTPHWTRAMKIHLKLSQVEVLRSAYWEMTNIAPFPIVMIDNAGATYLSNRRADDLLRGDGLSMGRHGLHATMDCEDQRLQQAIRSVVSSTNSTKVPMQGTDLSVSRPSGKRPYRLVIAPLSPAHEAQGRRPAAAVIIFDPDSELEVPVERLREIFGFTRAEAQVAVGIMQGKALESIAATQGNSIATTRNLLKRVFLKAGVNRQSELAMVMLNSPLFFDISNLSGSRPGVRAAPRKSTSAA